LRFSAGAADSYARAVSASSGIVIVTFCIVLPHNYSTAKNRAAPTTPKAIRPSFRDVLGLRYVDVGGAQRHPGHELNKFERGTWRWCLDK